MTQETEQPQQAPSGRIRLSELQNNPGERGLECRTCGCRHFYVVYTRPIPGGIRRCRECRHCGRRIATTERGG